MTQHIALLRIVVAQELLHYPTTPQTDWRQLSKEFPLTKRSIKEHWTITKPAVKARGGMVSSQHHLASDAGLEVLQDGGNAIDAAIATGLMLGVVEPWMSGFGGGGYLLAYLAKEDRVVQIEFGMQAPAASKASDYPLEPGGANASDAFNWPKVIQDRNIHGPLAIATPGYFRGIELASKTWGSRPLSQLIEPARQQAEQGLPVDWFTSQKINHSARGLRTYEGTRSVYLSDGLPPAINLDGFVEYMPLPHLGQTLGAVQQEGAKAIYDGALTQSILEDLAHAGSHISRSDLQDYSAHATSPLSSQYRDHHIFTAGPLTAGPSLLQALEHVRPDLTKGGDAPDADDYVSIARALQATYQNRLKNLGEGALGGNTTHICVADSDGNMVSLTQTIMSAFGARILLPQTGLLMNNGMMWFDPRPGGPNSVLGRRRPLCNMCPTLARMGDGTWIALGACGGRKIFPSVFQLLLFMLDYSMDVDETVHQPRIDVSGTDIVTMMAQLPESVQAAIEDNFEQTWIRPNGVAPNHFALPQVIARKPDGPMAGACFVPSPHAKVAAY